MKLFSGHSTISDSTLYHHIWDFTLLTVYEFTSYYNSSSVCLSVCLFVCLFPISSEVL